MKRLIPYILELVRFGSVGLTSALVYFAVFWALSAQIGTTWILGALAYFPSMLVNYLLHRSFTFRSDRQHLYAGPRYIIIQGGGLFINSSGLWLGARLGLQYWLAQLLAIAALAVFSYVGQRFWTFAPSGIAPTSDEP